MLQRIYHLLRLHSLKRRLCFWFICLFLLLFSSVIPFTFYVTDFREQEAHNNIQQMISLQQLFIDNWFNEKVADIQFISQLPVVKSMNKEKIEETLNFFSKTHTEFHNIVYINKHGVSEVSTSESTGIDFSDREYFQEAKKGNSFISDVLIGKQTKQPIITFSSPVFDVKNEFQGLIFGAVYIDTINKVMEKFSMNNSGKTYLITQDGMLLTEPKFAYSTTSPFTKINTEILTLAIQNKNVTKSYEDYNGITVFGDYRWVNDDKWLIIGEIAKKDVFSPIYQFRILAISALFIAIIIVLGFTVFITKQIEGPINKVLNGSLRMGKANYDYRIYPTSYLNYPVEFQKLCETFNHMARMIQSNMHSVQKSEERYRKLVESSPNATIVHQDGRIVYANPASIRLLKYSSEEELLGRNIMEYVHPDYHEIVKKRIQQLEANGSVDLIEEQYVLSDGSIIYVEVIATPVEYMDKPAFQVIIEDITERKVAEQKLHEANELLRHLSSVDGLTGVNNRRSFDERFEIEWQRSIQNSTPLSLIMLDIDCFKSFNDTYGHQGGDECLKQVAKTIFNVLEKPLDGVYRYGGEEFSVILPETTKEGAQIVAEKIRIAIEKLEIPHASSTVSEWVTISLGTATTVPTKCTPWTDLVAAADKALYRAKNEGRNCVRSY